ncbi:MAG: hypothetical protein DYH05_05890 [Acidobacteria bacterium ACB1]|nr:hypothetical protein [Pyrinomonadaceae bacterium]MCE7962016.1 hypothetical protein [Acidobacteria bacterium ACB1]RIJ92988.1 MAG: hypothetical protein DCC44_07260 [Acidobacteriota bacterium]
MQVFFRPKFCVNCGEKIIRDEWNLWTSGRFCELCETEFRGRETARRVAAVLAVLGIAAVGFAFVIPQRPLETRLVAANASTGGPKALVSRTEPAKLPANQAKEQAIAQKTPESLAPSEQKPEVVASEPTYMCGAETKKGTPCTRKVKGNVRCWQHKGMPAILNSAELRVR